MTGERVFDPGVACVHGHRSMRWTNNGICVACKRARDIRYNDAHKKEHLARSSASRQRRIEAVRAYRKAEYAANREKAKMRTREWQENNPARVRESKRAWDRLHAAEKNAKAAAARRANPERFRATHRMWKRDNKHMVRAAEALRRAREKGAAVGCRKAYAAYVRWAQSARVVPCYWCKKATRPGHRHIDHIIPLARGGADAVANLCVACPPCNQRKCAKMPEHFAGQSELALA